MIDAILLIVIGLIAAMSVITKMVKNSEKLLSKLVPFQGILGVIAFIWGIWGVISVILRLGWLVSDLIGWITFLAITVLELVLGFILGFGLISKYVLSKNEEAKKKGEEILAKLAGYQTLLGIIAICVGLWYLIYRIVIYSIIYAVS